MSDQPFQYCLNTSTIREADITLEDKIRITAEAGYDGIEPWVKEIDAYVDRGGDPGELRARIEDAGLEVVNVIGFFEWAAFDDAKRELGFREARRCFELASQVGAGMVAAPPSGIADAVGLDLYAIADHYAALIDEGLKHDVIPVLEFWGFARTLGHLGEALLVASECGRSEACILADVFHMYKSTGRFEGLELLGPKTLGLFHVNDYPAAPPRAEARDSDRVYPGDGIAPLTDIFRSLHEAGFDGMLSLELFNATYWAQDPADVARTGLEKLKAAVASALE